MKNIVGFLLAATGIGLVIYLVLKFVNKPAPQVRQGTNTNTASRFPQTVASWLNGGRNTDTRQPDYATAAASTLTAGIGALQDYWKKRDAAAAKSDQQAAAFYDDFWGPGSSNIVNISSGIPYNPDTSAVISTDWNPDSNSGGYDWNWF